MFKSINESFEKKFNDINNAESDTASDSPRVPRKRPVDRTNREVTPKQPSKSVAPKRVKKEGKLNEAPSYDMRPQYDSRQSFYNKARVDDENGVLTLYSYNTPVARISNGKVELLPKWDWSQTTLRHVKEFLKQNGFEAASLKQMRDTYTAVNESSNIVSKKTLTEAPIYDLTDDEVEFLKSRKTTRIDISDREAKLIDERRASMERRKEASNVFRRVAAVLRRFADSSLSSMTFNVHVNTGVDDNLVYLSIDCAGSDMDMEAIADAEVTMEYNCDDDSWALMVGEYADIVAHGNSLAGAVESLGKVADVWMLDNFTESGFDWGSITSIVK